ncbi:2-nitropropane dioxygenase [candidate division WOR-1 bacterium DG_54_3]|uniref:2-nitropropane dioxygenase n=1 Tax=candidate division WOR-1 bacterium DG_54_3 TaxID=1703775 RepID=A0A0S7Y0G2_UNCSA|nr:MAG: 2-nitropropane dioxygenase [candidate division WOR-1 bacterium DG_54_3]
MKLPELKIGNLVAKLPLIQGGMAIRISTGSLAGAVAAAGGIGVIGASGMAFEELRSEIRLAREKAKGGIIGINIMYAAREFWGIVKTAIKEKIDLVFTGAGFSRDIFKLGQESKTPIIPIVSSARLAKTSDRCGAAAVVVEGKEAGGHLGTDRSIKEILPEVRKAVDLPVIAAGGITDGKEIAEMFKLGANGVQIATRFVLSEECNAALPYKKRYQEAKKEDVVVITSPVGMPGRALKTAFVEKILKKDAPKPIGCDFCLKHCSLEYCIIQALINSQQGDIENGIVFSGEHVWKIKDRSIKPAAKIIQELLKEVEEVPDC